ncbi:MAG: penicillin-binding transpeptidase domain-containing protein [Clostridiales bacterium]|nr:penicillin-binding transpeptidase domain-containing protein [Clostridiales bacterium]
MNTFKYRFQQIAVIMFVLMTVLFIRLFVLTVIQTDSWAVEATNLSIKSVFMPAPRGEIYDRYGRVLAGNVQIFSLKFGAYDYTDEEANEISAKLIKIMESNGDSYYDNLPILIEDGKFVYTYQKSIEEWLESMDMPLDYTAEQAFDKLREMYDVPERFDKFEAQAELQGRYNVYPPISVKNMVFSKDLDKDMFLGRYYLKTDLTAEEAFLALRAFFKIDKTVRGKNGEREIIRSGISNEEARKVIVVRNEVSAMGFRQYIPATIASNLSQATIVQIEEMSRDLPGVEIVSESRRTYPNGNSASHIIGYMGHISEQDMHKYKDDDRYSANDLVGLDGIENSMESLLKGNVGVKYVQVNVKGELVKVIDEKAPAKGRDIYLTVDIELQKTAEEALAQALEKLQKGGIFESDYGNYKYSKPSTHANVGAVVAIEVKTGDVLAMASNPDFDPNEFTGGISKEAWDALQSKNPRDPISPVPLYNVAAKSAVQPGSAFKMVTASAALSCGLDPKMRLHDGGRVMIAKKTFGCLLWNTSGGSHGSINLAEALRVSCNYYFFDIATGRDFARGERSLGYREPINIDKIMSYAKQYGLGVPTGIEIEEAPVSIPDSETKLRRTKASLANILNVRAERYFKPEVLADSSQLRQHIDEIVSWTEENPSRNEVIRRMADAGVKDEMIVTVAELCKFDYFNFAKWTLGDELNISIGQGENAYTPLQMANYLATLGNGGVHNNVSLISAIEGEIIEKSQGEKVDINNDLGFDEIMRGMKMVAGPGGTLNSIFGRFPVQVAAKTGTAQREGRIHPPDEVAYMQANLRRIAPSLKWEDVEAEMARLLSEFPETWKSKNTAVRQAVMNLSDGRVTYDKMDEYKEKYKPFAWVLAMAPADDPKIAVAVLLFQGDTSINAAPVAREVIGKYLQLDKAYEDMSLNSEAD